VLWGQVHNDSQHVAAALWQGRNQFGTTQQLKERYDAAFYAMLVSIAPNADFTMVASTMAARVGTAFSSNTMAAAQMTQIFTSRGVIGCSKTLTVDGLNFPRPYYGIPSVQGFGNSLIPGPVQFKVALPTGAARIRVTGAAGGGGPFGGQPPMVRVLAKKTMPITFTRQGGTLINDSEAGATMTASGQNVTAAVEVNAACNTEVYLTLASVGGGATLQNVSVQIDPLVNCMIPVPDAGTGGGGATGGGSATGGGAAGGGSAAGGGGGGNSGTVTLISVGPNSTTQQTGAMAGCGCTSLEGAGSMLMLLALALRRRRTQA
jgi:uncharacterized protein (TIGR03382 family)